MSRFIIFCAMALSLTTQAQEAAPTLGLTNETALGYVVTGGNSSSETTSFNQKLNYSWTRDILKFTGHYIQTSGQDPQTKENLNTAENWSATFRFERVLNPKRFNAYFAYGWYGDRFQGVREGQATDIGGKYYFIHREDLKFHTELGYRYTRELLTVLPTTPVGVGHGIMPEYHYLRSLLQVDYNYSKTFALGAWVEFLPSVTNFTQDQRINYSPYLTSVLTDIFSLKVAYEARYRFPVAVAGNQNTDFTFTTSLLAKF